MSWQVAAILFAISAFEGVRPIEPDDLVLRCNPLGVWRVYSPVQLWRRWHLVSVLSPFFLTIVTRREAESKLIPGDASDIRSFAGSIEPILALRLLGALDFVALVFGIPWGIAHGSAVGLFAFLGCALALSAAIALRLGAVFVNEGAALVTAVRRAISFLSPFASPLAAEAALSIRLQRYSQLAVTSELLGDARFRAWIRPAAYDLESRSTTIIDSCREQIARALPSGERVRIMESAATGCTNEERYCPRCAERYSLESTSCADCDGIALRYG